MNPVVGVEERSLSLCWLRCMEVVMVLVIGEHRIPWGNIL